MIFLSSSFFFNLFCGKCLCKTGNEKTTFFKPLQLNRCKTNVLKFLLALTVIYDHLIFSLKQFVSSSMQVWSNDPCTIRDSRGTSTSQQRRKHSFTQTLHAYLSGLVILRRISLVKCYTIMFKSYGIYSFCDNVYLSLISGYCHSTGLAHQWGQ